MSWDNGPLALKQFRNHKYIPASTAQRLHSDLESGKHGLLNHKSAAWSHTMTFRTTVLGRYSCYFYIIHKVFNPPKAPIIQPCYRMPADTVIGNCKLHLGSKTKIWKNLTRYWTMSRGHRHLNHHKLAHALQMWIKTFEWKLSTEWYYFYFQQTVACQSLVHGRCFNGRHAIPSSPRLCKSSLCWDDSVTTWQKRIW